MLLVTMGLPILPITYYGVVDDAPTFGAYFLTVVDVSEYLG